jgi:hypothetical protein
MRGLRLRDAEKRHAREFVLANARGNPHPHSLSPSFATFFRLPPSRRSGVGPHDDAPAKGSTSPQSEVTQLDTDAPKGTALMSWWPTLEWPDGRQK